MGFIVDSPSSGEFESRNSAGEPGYHDMFDYSWGQFIARKKQLEAYNFSRVGMSARLIDSYIDYIIRHNPRDFETVPFIGTDLH